MNVTFIDLFDSLQFTQIKMKGGQLKRKPAAYFRPDEKRNGLTSLMFIPSNSVRGDYLLLFRLYREWKGRCSAIPGEKRSGKDMG